MTSSEKTGFKFISTFSDLGRKVGTQNVQLSSRGVKKDLTFLSDGRTRRRVLKPPSHNLRTET